MQSIRAFKDILSLRFSNDTSIILGIKFYFTICIVLHFQCGCLVKILLVFIV